MTTRARILRRFRPEGTRHARSGTRALLVLVATWVVFSPVAVMMDLGGRGSCRAEPAGNPNRPPPGTILLLLPTITGSGANWIAPWTNPSEAARFAKLEEELAARFTTLGYATMTAGEALGSPGAAGALRAAPSPISSEAAATAAREARATLALVIRAEALRRTEAGRTFTDALVSAEVYRSADAVKLAWASTRVSGTGASEAQADAAALSRAASPLFDSLAAPLLPAVQRPVVAPHPLTIYIEGDLGYRDYRRLIGLLQHEVPEIRELEERRFSHGRQTLRAICACQPWDIVQRLDGRVTGGFRFKVRSELESVRVHARPMAGRTVSP